VKQPEAPTQVHEVDFEVWRAATNDEQLVERLVVRCAGCGGETTLADNITASRCAFCGASVAAQGLSKKVIKPAAVLPFSVPKAQAFEAFAKWVRSRWFAPNAFRNLARAESQSLRGLYVPFWTYDTRTTTKYSGSRGDDYTVTEHYTETVNGRTEHRTRQVTHTRWSHASGTVANAFDDILVAATGSVPAEIVAKLEPWDLPALAPYADEYVAGFECESYGVPLEKGFERAKELMRPEIESTICADIGGDHQRISSMTSLYNHVTFKHILLPMWICSYRFRDKVFRFVVNARTGELQGERPWSWIKLTLLTLAVIGAVWGGVYLYSTSQYAR
jgi:hypothetical protein